MSMVAVLFGVLGAAVVLAIAWKYYCIQSSKKSSGSEEHTLPVYQPHQHQPVSEPLPRPPPLSQSYRSSLYSSPLPVVRQPEQHQPISQPPPGPSPSQSHQPSPRHSPPVHQPEQHQPIYQPPPGPSPSQSHQPSPQHSFLVYQLEQPQPVYQPAPPRPPPISQSYGPSPPSPHELPKHEDNDQADRPDGYYNASELRARANREGDEMARCFSESHEAYDRQDHAAAKELANQGNDHKQIMEQLNQEASTCIYREKNRGRPPGEIDLHGLYVKEAIAYTETALSDAVLQRYSELRLIVGKGKHSEGEAKVRPAIEELMRERQLDAELDPSNSGVLIVKLN
ncbi:hypothetical protein EDD18DRAFT_433283 [Armillaria luteobubalina]|uniref:Smr domain-containing protein n=1 Tax=Armillaria luteobubalina TaxID=153913 RepID=A0AA39UQP8_9AGAR|nr:hypothetical protein EDD18DRAFT_433283 [Armillaria luteobubalina]